MPTTTQLASLVVSAFDTFLIVDNSCLSAALFNVNRKPFSYCSRRYNHFLHMGPHPPPPGTHLHVATARKRSHQWCVSLTPNNTKTVGRMTRHCFLRPIRRDLRAAPTLLTHLETLVTLPPPTYPNIPSRSLS